MIDEHQEELAALHAFGLLEGADREQFESELARNPELQRLVADLRLSSTALAHTAPDVEPPAELKARVLSSVSGLGKGTDLRAAVLAPGNVVAFRAWIPWLAAACIAMAAVWSERLYVRAESENAALREQQRVAQLALDDARSQLIDAQKLLTQSGRKIAELNANLRAEGDLAHFKIATLASMLGNSPAALAVAVWDPTREEGVLAVSKLPALATEKDYQLWVIDKQYTSPVSGGVFVVDPATGEARIMFKADKPVHSIAKFAVSLERKGGSPSPQGPIVLLSE
jgi:anti-sigma-K factor RskA